LRIPSTDISQFKQIARLTPDLILGCTVRVTNKENGKSVVVKINDRGPFVGNRVLDLSYAASKALGFTDNGLAKVHIEVLSLPNKKK
jgi:rare lipoprotein A